MQDMEPVFQTEEFFHGPCKSIFSLRNTKKLTKFSATWMERFEHITKPLLHNLAIHFNKPSILHPDFIELGSGFWDLRGFTEQDFITQGVPKPYPMDSPIPFGNIGEEREKKWGIQARAVVEAVARYFPGENGGAVKDGPVISWRTLHHPKRFVPT